jgi:predicted AlkP superfamily pyrophosphatase or phosphodiesterase
MRSIRFVRDLIEFYENRDTRVVLLSEYGIEQVHKPVSLNRILRKNGYITVREEMGGEILIPGSSRAFAVADHQLAHIYIRNEEDIIPVKELLESVDGVEKVLDREGQKAYKLDHFRSGELVTVAEKGAWFTYYYWLDDQKAPDFAPTVDIHTKPGYDPAELLVDPSITFPKLKAGLRLMQKKLGFRYTMDLIPINGNGVKGSHGRIDVPGEAGPLVSSQQSELIPDEWIEPATVYDVIYQHIKS